MIFDADWFYRKAKRDGVINMPDVSESDHTIRGEVMTDADGSGLTFSLEELDLSGQELKNVATEEIVSRVDKALHNKGYHSGFPDNVRNVELYKERNVMIIKLKKPPVYR